MASKNNQFDYFEPELESLHSEDRDHTFIQNSDCTLVGNYIKSYGSATFLAFLYVASLYVWERKEISSHPETIKRRFVSIAVVCGIAPFYVNWFINASLLKDHTLSEILGFRLTGLVQAIILPFILTYILFLGPVSMEAHSGLLKIYFQPMYWRSCMKEWIWIRNYVIAPITEEFIFRACVLALFIHCTEPIKAVFICPIFFGTAHLHHMIEQIRMGIQWKSALLSSSFQFLYTSIFGAYSAYLFLRTGHIIAPIVVHSFCNHMGFPDFGALADMPSKRKFISKCCFVCGICGWMILLKFLTEPKIFGNNLPWSAYI